MGPVSWVWVVLALSRSPSRRALRLVSQTAVIVAISALPVRLVFAQATPTRTGWVTDEANALSDQAHKDLERDLDDFARRSSFEVAMVAVRSLGGRPIEEYSYDLAKSWKIGKEGLDNGVLVLVAIEDRKMRIETGKGVGHLITDIESREILDDVMRPKLKSGDTAGALREGARAVMAKLDRSPSKADESAPPSGHLWWFFGLGFSVVLCGAIAMSFWLSERLKWREKRKTMIPELIAAAKKRFPLREEIDPLLEGFSKEPWQSYPALARSTRDAYLSAFVEHVDQYKVAIEKARGGSSEKHFVQAKIASEEAYAAYELVVRLRNTVGESVEKELPNAFAELGKARAMIALLDERNIKHDAAGQLRDAEAMIYRAFRPVGQEPRALLRDASYAIGKVLSTWGERLDELGRQDKSFGDLAHSFERAREAVARGEAIFQQFRRDFPAESDGESPAAHMTSAETALAEARALVGVRSGDAIVRFAAAIKLAASLLQRARSAADRAPRLAGDRQKNKSQLSKLLDELRPQLALLRQKQPLPGPAIARIEPCLQNAEKQLEADRNGDFAGGLEDARRGLESCKYALAPASQVTTGGYESGSSSGYDGGSSGGGYDGGSSSGGGDSGGSSSGGGDFGGGGASSDW